MAWIQDAVHALSDMAFDKLGDSAELVDDDSYESSDNDAAAAAAAVLVFASLLHQQWIPGAHETAMETPQPHYHSCSPYKGQNIEKMLLNALPPNFVLEGGSICNFHAYIPENSYDVIFK